MEGASAGLAGVRSTPPPAPRPASQPVLMVWEHGGQLGHLARLLPVAQALRARGVPVTLAVAQPAAVTPFFVHMGVAVIQVPQVAAWPPATDTARCAADIWLRCGFANPVAAKVCVQQWLAVFAQMQPAAVLVDASPLALYAAQVGGLNAVAMGHGFELPPPVAGLSFTPWQENVPDDLAAKIAYSEQVLLSAFITLARSLDGVAVDGHLGTSVAQVLGAAKQALCTWPLLDHFEPATRQISNAVPIYLGPIWHDLPEQGAEAQAAAWPDKPGPKVLCYLNLVDQRYDLLWQALVSQGANVLVLAPAGAAWACKEARGWGVTVLTQRLSLGDLFPDCDAVIGHGGMGLCSMALHAGKPLLLMPTQLEQGLLAYRLTQRALAISSLNHLNKAQVKLRVEQLLHGAALKQRAALFASGYAGFGPQQAVRAVVDLLLNSAHGPDLGRPLDQKKVLPC